jgi:hypothetical protein
MQRRSSWAVAVSQRLAARGSGRVANAQAGSWVPSADQLAAIDEVVPPPGAAR